MWSSRVVIMGLICVKAADWAPAAARLRQADAVSALGVAVTAVVVTLRLGARAVTALMDAAPANMEDRIIHAAESVSGVLDCHNVRFRYSGPTLFVDYHVLLDGSLSLPAAHKIADQVERAIQAEVPGTARTTISSTQRDPVAPPQSD
jgi:divalent metal cation (Fe/Co/Zn/Cd) transporter